MSDTAANPLELSDEDFLKMTPPSGNPIEFNNQDIQPAVTEDVINQQEEEKPQVEAEVTTETTTSEEEKKSEEVVPPVGSEEEPKTEVKTEEPAEKKVEEQPKIEEKVEVPAVSPEDAQSFYQKVMAPFKANGKTIELKTPDEAIKLMQMGANYTKRMMEIQPHRKMIMMLQNNGLMDEAKLSYLIDLDKKNPEAIKKLIKDANIDPLDIDMNVDPDYRAVNHGVSDQEAAFISVLDDLNASETGKETLKIVGAWDKKSQDLSFDNPVILNTIHEQRENGVYDVITAEMERRKTLGLIAAETSFLEAYKLVGDELVAQATGKDANTTETVTQTSPAPTQQEQKKEPVVTRVATPKATVDNEELVKAAATTKAAPTTAVVKKNPLAMSDEDFMKDLSEFRNRL